MTPHEELKTILSIQNHSQHNNLLFPIQHVSVAVYGILEWWLIKQQRPSSDEEVTGGAVSLDLISCRIATLRISSWILKTHGIPKVLPNAEYDSASAGQTSGKKKRNEFRVSWNYAARTIFSLERLAGRHGVRTARMDMNLWLTIYWCRSIHVFIVRSGFTRNNSVYYNIACFFIFGIGWLNCTDCAVRCICIDGGRKPVCRESATWSAQITQEIVHWWLSMAEDALFFFVLDYFIYFIM